MFKRVLWGIFSVVGLLLGGLGAQFLQGIFRDFTVFGLSIGSLENKIVITASIALITGLIFFIIFSRLFDLIRSFATKIEKNLEEQPISKTMFGVLGLIIGLLAAFLISPLFTLIPNSIISFLLNIMTYVVFAYMGVRFTTRRVLDVSRLADQFKRSPKEKGQKGILSRKERNVEEFPETKFSNGSLNFYDHEDLDPQLAGFTNLQNLGFQRPKVLDTSVIIDGRIADIIRTGFLEGSLIIPEFVLEELRHIADSSDGLKRNRGRRGLDILNMIQRESIADIRITDANFEDAEVDMKLLKLAKKLNGYVVTNDFNLNKVSELQNVPVLNINELANAVKPVVIPGEDMVLTVVKEGKESNQGIAYLDDGTMIVIEGGKKHLNDTINVVVTSVLQTSAGKMIFAKPQK